MGETSIFTDQVIAALDTPLDMSLTSQRDGGRGAKLTYLEGHTVIAQLNRLFGPDNWGYALDDWGYREFTDGPEEKWAAFYWAKVTLTVRDSLPRQDIGRVEIRNSGGVNKQTGEMWTRNNVRDVDSHSTALTGAVTDGLKRAARTYGKQLGNGLYDKDGDVYRWMDAHPVEDDEHTAALREEVRDLIARDRSAEANLPVPVDRQTAEQLAKCKMWLEKRAGLNREQESQGGQQA